jgi:hypothetical protein
MTKLYDYLNWALALVVILIIATFATTVLSYYTLENTVVDTSQFVQNSVDSSRQNIREDLQVVTNKFNTYDVQLDTIQWRVNWIADNIKPSYSSGSLTVNLQLVHYIAEVEVCPYKHSSYKVKVDFYWINPRIESNRLLILDERLFSNYEAYNVYLPIYDKNTDSDADLCSIKIISSSNK